MEEGEGKGKGKLDEFFSFSLMKRKLKGRRESQLDISKLHFYPQKLIKII